MVDYLITSISELPLMVTIPGLGLCALLAMRTFGQIITLRWIKAATNLVYIFIILLILAKYGGKIASFLETKTLPQNTEQTQETTVKTTAN